MRASPPTCEADRFYTYFLLCSQAELIIDMQKGTIMKIVHVTNKVLAAAALLVLLSPSSLLVTARSTSSCTAGNIGATCSTDADCGNFCQGGKLGGQYCTSTNQCEGGRGCVGTYAGSCPTRPAPTPAHLAAPAAVTMPAPFESPPSFEIEVNTYFLFFVFLPCEICPP